MEELPDLAFERIVSYLNLSDRLMARSVSKSWRIRFDFKVKILCCSDRPIGFIYENRRWISGAFAKNFISSPRLISFLTTFAPTILSDLKHLRLCTVSLNTKNMPAFIQTLNSLVLLEKLDIISLDYTTILPIALNLKIDFKLNLPMLQSILVKNVYGIEKLTLDTPRLKKIKEVNFPEIRQVKTPSLDIVHAESVERLASRVLDQFEKCTPMKSLKNLLYLNVGGYYEIGPTFLSDLEHLKELHLTNINYWDQVSNLFEQKRRYGRTNLKIYRYGYLLDDPEDPSVIRVNNFYFKEAFLHLAEHPTRLADEIPFCQTISYESIEALAPEVAANLLSLFTDLCHIRVDRPVADLQHFLNLLKIHDFTRLKFVHDHPPELFERLHEYCAVQNLDIVNAHPDLRFVFKLKDLILLDLNCPIDLEFFFQCWKSLPYLSKFYFKFTDQRIRIRFDHSFRTHLNPFKVSVSRWQDGRDPKGIEAPDPNAVIQFIGWKDGLSFIPS